MLVLSRKAGETLRIGDDITITVSRIKGATVQLGIAAPRTTPIIRHNARSCDSKQAQKQEL